jgi:hypothetical protein
MGICHTCTRRKPSGVVRDVRDGALTDEDDVEIQLCVTTAVGDVALAL